MVWFTYRSRRVVYFVFPFAEGLRVVQSGGGNAPPLTLQEARLWWNQNVSPKSKGNHKATAQEPARTSVSFPPTFVPLLTTEGLCILLPMSFQRERTRLMKLKIFIFLLVNKPPSGGFVFQGR